MAERFLPTPPTGERMTRSYEVTEYGFAGTVLHLKVDGITVGELPFRSSVDAEEFGREYVLRDAERQAAMSRHPAGKRRLAER
jgi:hypothetical protein